MARTILLGTTTALAGVVWVAQQYGVAVADSLAFLGSSVVFVVALIGVGLVGACLLWLVRKLLGRLLIQLRKERMRRSPRGR